MRNCKIEDQTDWECIELALGRDLRGPETYTPEELKRFLQPYENDCQELESFLRSLRKG